MNNNQIISYLTLRKLIGIFAIALPIILLIGSLLLSDCTGVQSSISAYYYTIMRDVFVGILITVGIFLFAYQGYEKIDNIASNLGGFFIISTSLLPASISKVSSCIIVPMEKGVIGILHNVFAGLFFLVLIYFCLILFPKSSGDLTEKKKKRNILYKTCGYIILVSMIMIGVSPILQENNFFRILRTIPTTFVFEAIALFAFGLSWLVKGKAIMND